MKSFYLNDILKQLGDYSVDEKYNFLITQVEEFQKYLCSNMMLFHMEKKDKLNWNSFEKYNSFAVITEEKGKEKIETNDKYVVIRVDDIEKVFSKFLKFYRHLFNIPVYGITGTCGKSTTKEMLKYIFEKYGKVKATRGSANSNRLNLDYLTGIEDDTVAGIFELGVMVQGDIIDYCNYFEPTIGIITNISIDHLYYCETFENYIAGKAELLQGMSYEGTLILNADDENIPKIDLSLFEGDIIYFGKSDNAEFIFSDVQYGDNGMNFKLHHKSNEYELFIPGYGEHNVYNAVAAIAGAYVHGIDVEISGERLKSFTHMRNHLSVVQGINNCTILDDSWGANPKSTDNALKILQDLGVGKKKIVVYGRMSWQVSRNIAEEYKKIAKIIVDRQIDILITRGDVSKTIAETVLELGMNKDDVYKCSNTEEVFEILKDVVDSNSLVLLKTTWGEDFDDLLKKISVK